MDFMNPRLNDEPSEWANSFGRHFRVYCSVPGIVLIRQDCIVLLFLSVFPSQRNCLPSLCLEDRLKAPEPTSEQLDCLA